MPYCDVYIGDLSDPKFEWDCSSDKKWNTGNTPHGISPLFPPGNRPFSLLIDKIENKVFEGKQVDWGADVAKVNKEQILDFINECYKDDRTYLDPQYMPHLYPRLGELIGLVNALDPKKQYALVASEL